MQMSSQLWTRLLSVTEVECFTLAKHLCSTKEHSSQLGTQLYGGASNELVAFRCLTKCLSALPHCWSSGWVRTGTDHCWPAESVLCSLCTANTLLTFWQKSTFWLNLELCQSSTFGLRCRSCHSGRALNFWSSGSERIYLYDGYCSLWFIIENTIHHDPVFWYMINLRIPS